MRPNRELGVTPQKTFSVSLTRGAVLEDLGGVCV